MPEGSFSVRRPAHRQDGEYRILKCRLGHHNLGITFPFHLYYGSSMPIS